MVVTSFPTISLILQPSFSYIMEIYQRAPAPIPLVFENITLILSHEFSEFLFCIIDQDLQLRMSLSMKTRFIA